MQHRLDYIFISNNIQEYFKKVCILPFFGSDHTPIACILESSSQIQLGKNVLEFNSSLINDEKYVTQMKQHISEVKSQFNPALGIFKTQNSEIFYRILKNKAKREKLLRLEVKLKELE